MKSENKIVMINLQIIALEWLDKWCVHIVSDIVPKNFKNKQRFALFYALYEEFAVLTKVTIQMFYVLEKGIKIVVFRIF